MSVRSRLGKHRFSPRRVRTRCPSLILRATSGGLTGSGYLNANAIPSQSGVEEFGVGGGAEKHPVCATNGQAAVGRTGFAGGFSVPWIPNSAPLPPRSQSAGGY